MKPFFLTIRFYAPSYPPFDFYFYSTPDVIQKEETLKLGKPLARDIGAVLFDLSYTSTFDAQSQEKKKNQKRENLLKKKKREEKKTLLAFTVSLCFENIIFIFWNETD